MKGNFSRVRELLGSEAGLLLSDTTIVFLIRLLAALVTYTTQVTLARWMGAGGLGLVVYAMSWLWILGLCAGLGLGGAAIRFIPAYSASGDLASIRGLIHFSRRTVLATGTIFTLVGTAVLAVQPGPLSDETMLAYFLALIAIPAVALTSLNNSIARSFLLFSFASFTGVLLRPTLLLALILVARTIDVDPSPAMVMALLLGAAIVVFGIQVDGLRRRYPTGVLTAGVTQRPSTWLRVGLPIVVAELFVSYVVDVNIIISGLFLEPEGIAVYNAALRTVAIIAFGTAAVGLALAPRASLLFAQGDREGLQRLVNHATHLMVWPSMAAFIALIFGGRSVLGLFGPEFVSGYSALLVTAAGQVVIAAGGPLLPLLKVTGNHHRALVVCAVALLLTPLLYLLLMPPYGLIGGATAFFLISLLFSAWLAILVSRHVGVTPLLLGAVRNRNQD